MKSKKLSKEMIKCLEFAQKWEILGRSSDGLWFNKEAPIITYGFQEVPETVFGWGTIKALMNRGLLIVWNSRPGRYGVFPVEVKIAPDYNEKIKQY